jgi:hypothetical protein
MMRLYADPGKMTLKELCCFSKLLIIELIRIVNEKLVSRMILKLI